MRARNNELAVVADRKGPYLAMVAVELLNKLELVAVPVLEHFVLADGPEVMRRLALTLARVVALERDLHDTLIVREDRLVAVTEVEAPDLHVLVGRAGDDKFRVVRDVHREDRELCTMPVSHIPI